MLPTLQGAWITEALGGAPIPQEHTATCDRCVMCRPDHGPASPHVAWFDPSTKCCTYQPYLANFLVGAMLDDDQPGFATGRATIERRIDQRDGVSPLGTSPPSAYDARYREATRDPEAFGRTPDLRCPHLDATTGGCSIWAYRNAVCSTWFCKFDRGAVGRDFWAAVKSTLRLAELALARHCVLELGVGAVALLRSFPSTGDDSAPAGPPDPADYQVRWGRWAGRERAFYRACAAIARTMSWPTLLPLGGVELTAHLELLRAAHQRIEGRGLPARLRSRRLEVLPTSSESSLVTSYRIHDPTELPTVLVDALHRFDGQPVAEALALLREHDGLAVDDELLRRLVDFEVLVAVEEP